MNIIPKEGLEELDSHTITIEVDSRVEEEIDSHLIKDSSKRKRRVAGEVINKHNKSIKRKKLKLVLQYIQERVTK